MSQTVMSLYLDGIVDQGAEATICFSHDLLYLLRAQKVWNTYMLYIYTLSWSGGDYLTSTEQ